MGELTLDEYQRRASATAVYGQGVRELGDLGGIVYTALGLNGEAGELAEQCKKMLRDDSGLITVERENKMMKEAGDAQWYLSQFCLEMGWSLSEVGELNLEKLAKRQVRKALHGSGDDR
jgi:NTP pyrophosphatase (non-canonical NTP hydrolase)